jgi:hypothetical protein
MKRLIESLQDLKPALVGTAGIGATAILDSVNAAVGNPVGLTTLVYLVGRIRKELKSDSSPCIPRLFQSHRA